ncbi:MAG: hypothetical protein A3K19_15490 [Lentisphaerae bacterium RIFOXYB12_FULL_65_16]|nr:MAG: hypothetical protein A3K18_26455 [Lentisphaerae bacterium RIFOXYA12_64_32]OGV88503.1 MAG: hypothetical protein A3K19_15490 [Lentisphaerae bacterium RIFOXYB12_FULL_65_16]
MAWVLGGVLAAAFDLSRMDKVTLAEFRTKGVTEDGKVTWELRGGKAEVKAALADIEGIELKFHMKDRESVTITSPKCTFNQATQVGNSDAPIHMESKSFRLDGVGYDVFAGAHKVRIRQQVRMFILLDAEARRKVNEVHLRGGKPSGPAGAGGPEAKSATGVEVRDGQEAGNGGK